MNSQDFMWQNHEDRIKTLESSSANLLDIVGKQAVMVGLMAKAMAWAGAICGAAVLTAILKLVVRAG